MKFDRKDMLLYAVTDRSWLCGETLYEQAKKALEGGVTCLQIREKHLDNAAFLKEVPPIRNLCRARRVPCIINDRVGTARKTGADGVHLGQDDMEVGEARAFLGGESIIGVSARTVEQAARAQKRGADYLGVGAVFQTGTKGDAKVVGMDTLRAICRAVTIPVVAIGGICEDNLTELRGSGISGIAVVSAIFAQDDIVQAARSLREQAESLIS